MTGRALVVGGTGFVGRHLARQLSDRYQVSVSGRDVDIRDPAKIRTLVARENPDVVVNLAAITTVRESFENPGATYEISLLGLLNLFEVLDGHGFRGRFLEISSSEVYGHPASSQLPLTEASPIQPSSPYSVGKVAAEALAQQWNRTGSFEVFIARPFTHIGAGQSDKFSVSSFAKQVAEIIARRREPVVHVGNLTTTRDLTDVRDVVRAYDAIIHKGKAGRAYNVCSEREIAVRDVLAILIELSGTAIEVVEDFRLVRTVEQQRLWGSCALLRADTGWRAEISLASTLMDIFLYWHERISAEQSVDK